MGRERAAGAGRGRVSLWADGQVPQGLAGVLDVLAVVADLVGLLEARRQLLRQLRAAARQRGRHQSRQAPAQTITG